MNYDPSKLIARLPAVARRQCNGTLRLFISEFQIPSKVGTLAQVGIFLDILSSAGLVLIPDVSLGDLDSARMLVFEADSSRLTTAEILDLIFRGESNKVEFKSTFFIDRRKYEKIPGLQSKEYRSDEVIHSALKTIAGYLNTDGGILLIGVTDEGETCGINIDHMISSSSNEDKWQLCVRATIEGCFKDGKTINPYVSIEFNTINETRIAIIKVLPKLSTSFLKSTSGSHTLYVRNGNRTDSIDITQAEQFFRLKWEQGR